MKKLLCMLAACAMGTVFANVEVISPENGGTYQIHSKELREVLSKNSHAERVALLKADLQSKKSRYKHANFGKPMDLVVKWRATANETGTWFIKISDQEGMGNAREYWRNQYNVKKDKKDPGVLTTALTRLNYQLGSRHYLQVCVKPKKGDVVSSPVVAFTASETAPRLIAIEGNVDNMRDLGGRTGLNGRKVKQGLIYRGQQLNYGSLNGVRKGRNRLYVEDVAYLTQELGIKTDLDLRAPEETADMTASPLGDKVKFVRHSSTAYQAFFKKGGMETTAKNFRLFCDEANYPIYFHCMWGADRTGSLAYVLNGVLGVSHDDLEKDWEMTFYPFSLTEFRSDYKGNHDYWPALWHFDEGFAKFGDANTSLTDRCVKYLLDCGITMEEIEKFRSIMLEPAK